MGIIVDGFAGAGGASLGIHMATGRHPDAAINHDPVAVAVHALNHPTTYHHCQNIWTVHPAWVSRGRAVDLFWASPDCTHHSKAKGAAPTRDERRRDLAMVIVDKWVPALRPRLVILENVEEFEDWGPLDSSGRIVQAAKGQKFREFLNRFRRYGYAVEFRLLRACDYGAPTTRRRLYLIARCDGRPIIWPTPTHGAPKSPEVLAGLLKPWRTAGECIDWSIPCPSIFATSEEIRRQYGVRAIRPLAENTLRRIAKGITRYVLNNPMPYITSYYGLKAQEEFRGCTLTERLPTQTTENRFALVQPFLAHLNHTASYYQHFRGQDAQRPFPTITTTQGTVLCAASMVKMRGENVGDVADAPLHTISAGGTHHALATAHVVKFKEDEYSASLTAPAPTVCTKVQVGVVAAFLAKYYGQGEGQSAVDSLHTVTTSLNGEPYSIVDIGMRMLQPRELAHAMGFPNAYILERGVDGRITTKTEQVRLIGNAVCPDVAAVLVKANYIVSQIEEIGVRPMCRAL